MNIFYMNSEKIMRCLQRLVWGLEFTAWRIIHHPKSAGTLSRHDSKDWSKTLHSCFLLTIAKSVQKQKLLIFFQHLYQWHECTSPTWGLVWDLYWKRVSNNELPWPPIRIGVHEEKLFYFKCWNSHRLFCDNFNL